MPYLFGQKMGFSVIDQGFESIVNFSGMSTYHVDGDLVY